MKRKQMKALVRVSVWIQEEVGVVLSFLNITVSDKQPSPLSNYLQDDVVLTFLTLNRKLLTGLRLNASEYLSLFFEKTRLSGHKVHA